MAILLSQSVWSVKLLFANRLWNRPQVRQRDPEAPTPRSGEWVH